MEPSPQLPESPAKVAESAVPSGSLTRFQRLARYLFEVDQKEFQDAYEQDKDERRAKRGR